MDNLPSILSAISDDSVKKLQEGVGRVWQRFLYRSYKAFPMMLQRLHAEQLLHLNGSANNTASLPHTVSVEALEEYDDAFATILQWLHGQRPQRLISGAV